MRYIITIVCTSLFLIAGCQSEPVPPERGTMLQFVENDTSGAATPVRMVIGRKFLRIDGGEVERDFILFDREKRTIYNVSAADKLILTIPQRAAPTGKPPKLIH